MESVYRRQVYFQQLEEGLLLHVIPLILTITCQEDSTACVSLDRVMEKSPNKVKNLISQLARQAEHLPEPSRYYTNQVSLAKEWPRNIRVFLRRRIGIDGGALPRVNVGCHVLIANLRGKGEIFINNVPFRFQPGEVVVVQSVEFHHYAPILKPELRWLFISFVMEDLFLAPFMQHGPLLMTEEAASLLGAIVKDYLLLSGVAAASDALRRGCLAARLWLLLGELASQQQMRLQRSPQQAAGTTLEQELVRRADKYLLEHLQDKITLGKLAQRLAVSPSRLAQAFRKVTGRSVGSALRRWRINRAAALLKSSALGIKEISNTCGYSSMAVFSRTFRRVVGMSPSRYRQLNENR